MSSENFGREYRVAIGKAGEAGFEIGQRSESQPVPLHINFSIERTDLEMKKIQQTFAKTEAKSVESVFVVRGFSFAGTGQNMALGFLKLRDWSERTTPDTSVAAIQGRTMGILMGHPDFKQASTFVFPLPPVPELGVADGFDLYIQDNTGGTHDKLMQYMGQFLMKANADPRLTMVRHNGMADTTQLKLVLDYEKLSALNLSIGEVNSAISTVLSGSYVNDYMDRGRVKQVWVMGNTGSRMQPEDILGWHVRNANGEMVGRQVGRSVSKSNSQLALTTPFVSRANTFNSA